jgi:hypothetical protein
MTTAGREPQGVDELRDDIEHTRAELSDTLNELSARVNIPARAKAQVRTAVDRAPEPVQRALASTGSAAGHAGRVLRPYRGKILAGAGVATLALLIRRRRQA